MIMTMTMMMMIMITKTKTKFTCYSFLTSSQQSSIIAWIALTTRFEPENKESSIIIFKKTTFKSSLQVVITGKTKAMAYLFYASCIPSQQLT